MACHIYVIAGEAGAVKVGIASNVERRLRGMQGSSPTPLVVRYIGLLASRGIAHRVETRAHVLLWAYHAHGEWFAASVKMAVDAVILAAFEIGADLEHLIDPRVSHVPRKDDLDARRADQWARALLVRRRTPPSQIKFSRKVRSLRSR
jgi:hypothetical protein